MATSKEQQEEYRKRADEFRHHVTITETDRDGKELSMTLIGTKAKLAEAITEKVRWRLDRGGGPFTVTPIHPVNVYDLDA
jgi:uncharacterized coiled-coil DUF342 family protein